jgi:acetylornithine/succinyldiaminopimelate/putrescine aminotransferase
MNPEQDGNTHINIYSMGGTSLGRFLTNFAYSPIMTEDGHFVSIEGYWYWLSNRSETMRTVSGYNAKKTGRLHPKTVQLTEQEFQRKIREACWIKIHSNQHVLKAFKNSTLPFTHYYVFSNGFVKDAGYKWIVDMWELCRTFIKNGYK